MKIDSLLIAIIAIAATASTAAIADDIYKSTDAEGNVHYEDRPTGDPGEERLTLSFKRTDRNAIQQRARTQQESLSARREKAEEGKRTAAEQKAEAEERNQKCDRYRGQLQTMVQSRRLYREDENGERVYLDESERQEARTRVEELIGENCNQ